ncbi:WD40-repeat-containing domain protein [Limtongia smithiae]|uniref:WD40-repeat-containing domain protein n=1 Tax=Limtongia smithiae TaxID=1125753 RepID=UPI0034CD4270
MSAQQAVVPKYAHTPGLTRLTYSRPNGKYLLTVGTNRLIRKFTYGSEDEPVSIESHDNDIVGIASAGEYFATCSEDGTVCLFDLDGNAEDGGRVVYRQVVSIRDVEFSPDGQWLAIASDDSTVKLINTTDITRTHTFPQHRKSVKHISFDVTGTMITTTSLDGCIRIFTFSRDADEDAIVLLKTIEALAPALTDEKDETCIKVAWHPDGRSFAIQNKTRDVITVERATWNTQRGFAGGHIGSLTDYAWSPNGAYLATAGSDGKILIWDTKTQNIFERYSYRNVIALAWHPARNVLSFTTSLGQLYTLSNAVPANAGGALPYGRTIHASPLIDDKAGVAGASAAGVNVRMGESSDDEDILERVATGADGENWIVDDDGAGYKLPDLVRDYDEFDDGSSEIAGHKRRRTLGNIGFGGKRQLREALQQLQHAAFQPGSTPWQDGRRILAMNSVGYIWTVEQEMHNTVTVTFFDKCSNKEYYFTDHFLYDKACLSTQGAVFATTAGQDSIELGGRVFFREHGSSAESWDVTFPGEDVTALALSENCVVVCSSRGYVRIFNLYGTPLRMYRESAHSAVCCASWGDFVMVVRNNGDGRLIYSLENVKFDETFQKNDAVDVGAGKLVSAFFSEEGDPCIFDSEGVLLVLMHWRHPLQAKWVPLLETQTTANKEKCAKVWPLGVAQGQFQCIPLKVGDDYPSLPLPIFSELDLKLPIYPGQEPAPLEERYMRESVLLQLYKDGATAACGGREDMLDDDAKQEVATRELGMDKTALQMLQAACKSGQSARASGIAGMVRRKEALEAAGKIAERYDMRGVAERVYRELERRHEEAERAAEEVEYEY